MIYYFMIIKFAHKYSVFCNYHTPIVLTFVAIYVILDMQSFELFIKKEVNNEKLHYI
jgi:hypothetical protein